MSEQHVIFISVTIFVGNCSSLALKKNHRIDFFFPSTLFAQVTVALKSKAL